MWIEQKNSAQTSDFRIIKLTFMSETSSRCTAELKLLMKWIMIWRALRLNLQMTLMNILRGNATISVQMLNPHSLGNLPGNVKLIFMDFVIECHEDTEAETYKFSEMIISEMMMSETRNAVECLDLVHVWTRRTSERTRAGQTSGHPQKLHSHQSVYRIAVPN